MASFTDQRPAQFNPYIEQIPIDAYVTVGMQQQKTYDDHVNQIQQYINSLTDLPVLKGADVEYLNKKVSDLTSKINSMHSANWGNNSIFNQAGALASSVYRDPSIQNAVLSTQRIKQLQQSYRDLRDKHPDQYSQVNETYDMENAVNTYLNNGIAGELYSGPTSATIGNVNEVTKRLSDMVNKIKANKATIITPLGELMYQLEDKTYISEDQIKSMVQKNLSAQDLDLLHREAWYNLRQYDPTQLMDRYVRDTDQEINKRTSDINRRLTANALIKDSYQKNEDFKNIQANQDYVDQLAAIRNGNIDKYRRGVLNQNDISQIRDAMWNKNYIEGLAEFGAQNESKITLHTNDNAKFALEKALQIDLKERDFTQQLAIKMAEKHPETITMSADGKLNIDFDKLQAAVATENANSISSPIPVDLNTEGIVTRLNETTIATDVEGAKNARVQAVNTVASYLRTLPEFSSSFDQDGNLLNTPEAQKKITDAISVISRQIKQKAEGINSTISYLPKNPNQRQLIMEAALRAQEADLRIQSAMNLEDQATNRAVQMAKVPADWASKQYTFTLSDGTKRTYNLSQLATLNKRMLQEIKNNPQTGDYNMTGISTGSSSSYGPSSDEWDKLSSGPSGNLFRGLIEQNRRYIDLISRYKQDAYDELSKVNVPIGRSLSLPPKGKENEPTYLGMQNLLESQIGSKAVASSVRPIQIFESGGRKYVIAQYKPTDPKAAKKDGLVTQAVDVTEAVNMSPGTWFASQFGNDPNPDLTNLIEHLPQKKTPLNKSEGFKGALFTNNFNTTHYYQISKAGPNDFGKVPGKYYLTVAIPSEDGKSFTYEDLVNNFNLPADAQRYINSIFATEASTAEFYKVLNERK